MRSVSTLVLALVFGALVCFASPASATVIWSDNLETQPLGAVLTTLTPPTGLYYTGNAVGVVANASTEPAPGATNAGKFATAPGATNAFVELHNSNKTGTTGQVVKTTFDLYVVSDPGVEAANTAFAVVSGNKTAFQLNVEADDGRIVSYSLGWAYFIPGYSPLDAWVPVEVVADYTAQTYTASVGGVSWGGSFIETIGTQARLYLAPSSSSTGMYFDNVLVDIVPEPSALLLMVTGLLGLVAYAWRKRR